MWDELYHELCKHFQKGKKRLMTHQRHLPVSKTETKVIESFKDFTLVCQEDIFHPKSRRKPVLLLSKGQEISTRDLPKLIQHGVQPEQFRFKADENQEASEEEVSQFMASVPTPAPAGMDSSAANSLAWRPSGKRRTQLVVILESDPKILKRIIDCLFVCGFDLNRIHPVGMSANLAWTLQRYTPDLLVGSLSLLNEALNSETLKLLPAQLIMTLSQAPGEQQVTEVTLENGTVAHCLYRPITRFSLRQLLMRLDPAEASIAEPVKPKSSTRLSRRAMLKMG